MSQDLLSQISNAFDDLQPLQAGDPAYVDCAEVRGDTNILVDLGNKLLRSDRMVCQLYAGHRGGGKSTELLRLKDHLEKKGSVVVYFAADEDDIDPEGLVGDPSKVKPKQTAVETKKSDEEIAAELLKEEERKRAIDDAKQRYLQRKKQRQKLRGVVS